MISVDDCDWYTWTTYGYRFFSLLFKRGIRYLWYDPTQYLPLFFSYLLTTNFGRYCCLIGCWSILTFWWSSITSKTCWDNVYTGKRELHKFSNFNYIAWEKRFFPFLVDVFLLFHIDVPRYVFRAKKLLKTLNKMKGAGGIGDTKSM